jgi:hypothetical protein
MPDHPCVAAAAAAAAAVSNAACYCCSPQTQDQVRNIFLGFVGFFLVVGVVNLMAGFDYAQKKLLW